MGQERIGAYRLIFTQTAVSALIRPWQSPERYLTNVNDAFDGFLVQVYSAPRSNHIT